MINNKSIEESILAPVYKDDQFIKDYFKVHIKRYVETVQLLSKIVDHDMKIIDLASVGSLVPPLNDILGVTRITCTEQYDEKLPSTEKKTISKPNGERSYSFTLDRFDIEDSFPYPDETFDIVIFTEVLEHISVDPMNTLSEINRVTKKGGWLVLSTPNCASTLSLYNILTGYNPYIFSVYAKRKSRDRHNREYVPWEIGALLEASGYEISKLTTKTMYTPDSNRKKLILTLISLLLKVGSIITLNNIRSQNRGDSIFALAKKTSGVIERYPSFLYFNDKNYQI